MRFNIGLVLRSLTPRIEACLTTETFGLPRAQAFLSLSSIGSVQVDLRWPVDFLFELEASSLYLFHQNQNSFTVRATADIKMTSKRPLHNR